MSRIIPRAMGALLLFVFLLIPIAVLAHEKVEVGNYVIEYGWTTEPPLAGQANAIVINISGKAEDTEHLEAGKISIVAPAADSTVQGDKVEVAIKAEGIDEHDAEALHWHLYVDERVLTMPPLSQTTVTITGLSNGTHTLEAKLAAADHSEAGAEGRVVITVEGSTATGDPAATGGEPMAGDDDHGHGEEIEVDVSGLKIELVYGGQTIALTLQPVEGKQSHFTAPFTPERPGLYTLRLIGKLQGSLGETEVNVEVEPEEVAPAPTPVPGEPGSSSGAWLWFIIGGVVVAALVIGGMILLRRKQA